MKWWIFALLALCIIGVVWFMRYLLAPPPGTQMPDMGREHVTTDVVAATHYNTNPPTSGSHLPTWVKAGIYTAVQLEGELLHSLEHGYIEVNYNCANLSTESCKSLVSQLETVVRKKGLHKLILVPRPQIDTAIALTAWTYIDKFEEFDGARIERFIDYHRDHGPEQTME